MIAQAFGVSWIAARRRPVKNVQAIDGEEARVLAKVSLRNIAKRFGSAQLFDRFNLDVADGELLCLLGPSGSGRTTLMRMIALPRNWTTATFSWAIARFHACRRAIVISA